MLCDARVPRSLGTMQCSVNPDKGSSGWLIGYAGSTTKGNLPVHYCALEIIQSRSVKFTGHRPSKLAAPVQQTRFRDTGTTAVVIHTAAMSPITVTVKAGAPLNLES
ncbi:hypothetical protein BaRGS_00003797 [Batillaria attramentaria]|uniref:Uncharacterized protein n=1 Tax=Batillaria attramentaria TaxID=370345 RepID=A0ABD0LYJ5_9CAEN